MDIAEVTRRTGISNAALHHYEHLGLITPMGRVGFRRQYDDSAIEALAVIILCQRSGFTLAEIGELTASTDSTAWRRLAAAKLAELDARIVDLQRARDGLRHAPQCPNPDILRCDATTSAPTSKASCANPTPSVSSEAPHDHRPSLVRSRAWTGS